MTWINTFLDICMAGIFGAYCLKIIIGILRGALTDENEKQQRVVAAAEKLAKAGEAVGVGELPSNVLHELYDAVREYQS
jgi:hypothetical protein